MISIKPETFNTLLHSKATRIRLGGDNLHLEQCNSVPGEFNEHLFYHRECQAKFNSVKISVNRKLTAQPATDAKRYRRSDVTERSNIVSRLLHDM